ncbi:MAG: histidine kinase [Massilia sp.]|nr:histidine kinase [Massilia sp.]
MTAPAHQPPEVSSDRLAAARSADLAELLAHVTTSWDEQRRLLARQLHDSLGSSMTALSMHLALLTQKLPADTALHERSAQMKQLLSHIITANREMQRSLWNDQLEFLGIQTAINALVREFGDRHQIAVCISLPEHDSAYPRLIAVALLRCLEEGLRNVAAHAHASDVAVILDDDGDQITLTVRDNGVGIGPAPLAAAVGLCHGLRTLRERAAYLGGELSVSTAPHAHGTVLTLTLPGSARANGTR